MRTPLTLRHLPICFAATFVVSVALLAAPGCSSGSDNNVSSTCGNGTRDTGEQCDDGNKTGLDGCSSTCMFEQVQRMNSFVVQYGTDNVCANNAFGGAIGSLVQTPLETELSKAVASGSLSILMEELGTADLSGADQTSVQFGFLNATPVDADGGSYNGASDLDWWYTPSPSSLSNGVPTSQMTGSISGGVLTLGPAPLAFQLGSGSPVAMSNLVIQAAVGPVSTPTESTNGSTPGHLASENLDPTLQSFSSLGANSPGTFCGNVSAASLQSTALPSVVSQYCSGYTATNTLLDLLVSGCSYVGVTAVAPTQPDQVDSSKPQAGAGGPYSFTADSNTHVVNGCTDKNGATATLSTCVAAAAYSAYFQFSTDRVMFH